MVVNVFIQLIRNPENSIDFFLFQDWKAQIVNTSQQHLTLPLSVCPKDGRADVVANDAGDRVTPAIVAYRDSEQVCDVKVKVQFLCYICLHRHLFNINILQIVGIAAKQGRVRNAANTVVKVKQVLGRRW